jgi:hypothetical protein
MNWTENDIFLLAHPVGSFYCTSASDEDTAAKIAAKHGGTWEKLPQGTFIRAAGATAGGTGGEASHVLTVSEMPSHSHPYSRPVGNVGGWPSIGTGSLTLVGETQSTSATGSGAAHNNLPPYKDCHVYERTA